MQLSQKQSEVRPAPGDMGRPIDLFLPDNASSVALVAVREAVQMATLVERHAERTAPDEGDRPACDAATASKRGLLPRSMPSTKAERRRDSVALLARSSGTSTGERLGRQLPRGASGGTAPSDTAVQVVGAVLRHWYAAAVGYQRVADRDAIDVHLHDSVLGTAHVPGLLTAAARVLYWRAVVGALGRAGASEAGPGIDLVRASAVREIAGEVRRLAVHGGSAAAEADARLAALDRMVLAAATGRWGGELPTRRVGVSEIEWTQLTEVAEHFLPSDLEDDEDASPPSAWLAPWPVDSVASRAESGPTGGAGWPVLERATASFLLEGLVRAAALEGAVSD